MMHLTPQEAILNFKVWSKFQILGDLGSRVLRGVGTWGRTAFILSGREDLVQ
jgi:hypothetical protein